MDMKLLSLHDGTFAEVDDEDFERLSMYDWCHKHKTIHRSEMKKTKISGYTICKQVFIPLANEVMQIYGVIFDHKDRNYLNNLRSNLRQASYSQNTANRVKIKNTSSKYKGVSWFPLMRKWRVRVKQKIIGYFDSEIDAALAYDKEALITFGEFAVLNFPEQAAFV